MDQPQQTSRANKRRKGPRPKHVPQRTCVACREKGDKRGLVRIVRTTEGRVEIDPSGKKNGRGAYLCHRVTCWERALQSSLLARALNTEVADDARVDLQKYAESLDAQDASTDPVASS